MGLRCPTTKKCNNIFCPCSSSVPDTSSHASHSSCSLILTLCLDFQQWPTRRAEKWKTQLFRFPSISTETREVLNISYMWKDGSHNFLFSSSSINSKSVSLKQPTHSCRPIKRTPANCLSLLLQWKAHRDNQCCFSFARLNCINWAFRFHQRPTD